MRRLIRGVLHNAMFLVSLLLPMWYVHAISSTGSLTDGSVSWLIMASIVFKMLLQEGTKYYLLKTRILNLHTVVSLVCTPTLIVDTQVRIAFLRFQSQQATVATTLILALAEFVLRVTRSVLLMRRLVQMRRVAVATHDHTGKHCDHQACASFVEATTQLERQNILELSAGMFVRCDRLLWRHLHLLRSQTQVLVRDIGGLDAEVVHPVPHFPSGRGGGRGLRVVCRGTVEQW